MVARVSIFVEVCDEGVDGLVRFLHPPDKLRTFMYNIHMRNKVRLEPTPSDLILSKVSGVQT